MKRTRTATTTGGNRGSKRGKKDKKNLTPEEQAIRDEFCSISSEVYAFGKNEGLAGARKNIYDYMPNADIDKDKQKKRPPVPYKIYQRAMKNRKLEEEKRAANAPPVMDDPLAALLAKKKKKSGGRTMAEYIRQKAGNRSGMSGIGDGSRGINPTSVGRFRDGILHISQKEIDARTGNRGGPRRLGALTKGRSTAPIGNRAVGWMKKGRSKKRR